MASFNMSTYIKDNVEKMVDRYISPGSKKTPETSMKFKDVLMFLPKSDLLGVIMAVIQVAGQRFWQYEKPTWQFWDSGRVKLESLCNFSIVGCQWTANCLLGGSTVSILEAIGLTV